MTKYILNSGGGKNFPEKEKAFSNEILKGFDGEVKILYCLFAQPREHWETKFEGYQENFKKMADSNFKLIFDLALPDKFEEQVAKSDVILIQGGDDELVQYRLSKFDLPNIFDGKIVVGSSAGSDALVSSFWTCDWRKCMDGLGILSIKFNPHFRSETFGADDPRGPIDWDKAYEELKNYGDKTLPIHALEEGDFVVIEQ